MPYIIDGHNLIPKIPGLKLNDVDDELQLVKLLQDFCRVTRKNVEVFFDQAPAGSSGARTYGCVVARFIRQGRTADQAIHNKLRRLGGEARNWTVVSSDQEVRRSARSARAKSMRVEDFAEQLLGMVGTSSDDLHSSEGRLSAQEVDEWMELFGADEGEEEK
jgi:predicted RNA-binding protein with PIN domain